MERQLAVLKYPQIAGAPDFGRQFRQVILFVLLFFSFYYFLIEMVFS